MCRNGCQAQGLRLDVHGVQMLDALRDLFTDEGRVGHWEPIKRDHDPAAHTVILEAVAERNASFASERMVAHLESVRKAVARLRS